MPEQLNILEFDFPNFHFVGDDLGIACSFVQEDSQQLKINTGGSVLEYFTL